MNMGFFTQFRNIFYRRIRTSFYSINKKVNVQHFRPLFGAKTSKFVFGACCSTVMVVKAFPKKSSGSGSNHEVIEQADRLYDDTKFVDLYTHLSAYGDSEDAEILWRLARALFEKCRNVQDNTEKLALYEEALSYVIKALDADETCWAAHKWAAILLDYVWRMKSTKGRILQSFEVRKHMERAIELNPNDSTSYYLLGEWCFTFAELPWYQRKAAAVLFASPPTSTYEEALHYFEAAEKIDPYFYSMNLLMIGKCLLKLNEKDKAISFLKQAQSYPQKTADDIQAYSEAEELLKKLI